ncbi:MAG TPA: hypothetical protein VG146_10515, partial [Verrucomicrobiae bacterium]|nr:hypothetical protein [Verrucomicrobiae bacterium]
FYQNFQPFFSTSCGMAVGFILGRYSQIMYGVPTDPMVEATKQRHSGLYNVGFCDGHVEGLRGNQLFDVKNPNVMRRWNNDHLPHH